MAMRPRAGDSCLVTTKQLKHETKNARRSPSSSWPRQGEIVDTVTFDGANEYTPLKVV